jgi:hypothetical protein
MKNHESIKNIAIASVERHSIDIDQWEKTRISKSQHHAFIERLDNELPVLEYIFNEANWTIITTKRIVGKIDGNQNQVDFSLLDDVVYGDTKDARKMTTLFRTIDVYGGFVDFLMDTEKPSTAFISSINMIAQLYRSESRPKLVQKNGTIRTRWEIGEKRDYNSPPQT